MSAYLDWHLGMDVVNVRPVEFTAGPDIPKIEIGAVYTISGMRAFSAGETINGVRLGRDYLFVELVGQHGMFDAELFRPAQKRATDISTLRALLNPSPEQIADLIEHEIYEDARSLAEELGL